MRRAWRGIACADEAPKPFPPRTARRQGACSQRRVDDWRIRAAYAAGVPVAVGFAVAPRVMFAKGIVSGDTAPPEMMKLMA